jgi:ABC-type oligopeptide transport system substrate-binding subunit
MNTKIFAVIAIISLLVLAGCAKVEKQPVPVVKQTEPSKVILPDLSKGVSTVDASTYKDPQGSFIAQLMNQMVEKTKAK